MPTTSPVRVSASLAGDPRDAEVGQLGRGRRAAGALGDEDVQRLDVAVHDAARVRVRERVAERDADLDARRGPTARPRASSCASVAPRDELGDQVDAPRRRRRPRRARRSPGAPAARRPRASRWRALGRVGVAGRDPLDRDGRARARWSRASQTDAEAARAEPRAPAGSGRARAGPRRPPVRRSRSSRARRSPPPAGFRAAARVPARDGELARGADAARHAAGNTGPFASRKERDFVLLRRRARRAPHESPARPRPAARRPARATAPRAGPPDSVARRQLVAFGGLAVVVVIAARALVKSCSTPPRRTR